MLAHAAAHDVLKVVTLEDTVEFLHRDPGKAVVLQRTIGIDTPSCAVGLERAVREDADTIAVDELADPESARLALRAIESGRQVFAVLQARHAVHGLERFLALIPGSEQRSALGQLAQSLEAIVALRMATLRDGSTRPVVEILRGGPIAGRSISEGRLSDLATYMTGRQGGMQTFDQHLAELYRHDRISGTEAMRLATNVEALARELQAVRMQRSSAAAATQDPNAAPLPVS
jgi:twitching motility protein PilT